MPRSAVLALAAAAFVGPIALVVFQNRDTLQEMSQPDPSRGELLFFTSPR